MSNNNYSVPTPTDASIILTYRCPMKCKMCNIWFNPTNKSEEIKAEVIWEHCLSWSLSTWRWRTFRPRGFGGDCGGMLPAYRPYCHFDEWMVWGSCGGADLKSFQISASAFPSRGWVARTTNCAVMQEVSTRTSHTADIEGNGAGISVSAARCLTITLKTCFRSINWARAWGWSSPQLLFIIRTTSTKKTM